MNLLRKIKLFNSTLNNQNAQIRHIEDVYCLELLNMMIDLDSFLPFTSMSLRPYGVVFLLNEILINQRKSIIEFGAGISTIMMAKLAKKNSLSLKITSIEENQEWIDILNEILISEKIDSFVEIIHAPLIKRKFKGVENHWYDYEILTDALRAKQPFDLIMIDGPTAFKKKMSLSRYYAMPFLFEKLENDHVIFLDDVNRDGEKKIMKIWKDEYGKNFFIHAGTLGVCYVGNYFESNPMKFITLDTID